MIAFISWALVALYVVLLFWLPKPTWGTRKRFRDKPLLKADATKAAEERRQAEVSELTAKLKPLVTPPRYDVFSKKLQNAIDYSIKRHDWYEDQRHRILTLTLAAPTLVLTIVGLLLKSSAAADGLTVKACIPVFVCALLAFVAGVVCYNHELDRDRPYRMVSDIRFWFFRYNLSLPSTFIKDQDEDLNAAKLVLEERKEFLRRTVTDFSEVGSLREDVEQLYILQTLQRSKTESLTSMRWIMAYTILILGVQLVLVLSA